MSSPDGYQPNRFSQSSRDLWEVETGEDMVRPVAEACSTGDGATLQSLLSQPHWRDMMFAKQYSIYYQDRPKQSGDEVREVQARVMSHIERCTTIAAVKGHADVVSRLLAFAKQQGVDPLSVLMRQAVQRAIAYGHAAVIEQMVLACPKALYYDLSHSEYPLWEAVRLKQTEVVAMLFKLGVDPAYSPRGTSRHKELLTRAAGSNDPRLIELLLENGVPMNNYVLGFAAGDRNFDTARLLLEYGAEINVLVSGHGTPMHIATAWGGLESMQFMESFGANPDAKDEEGRTPAELYEQIKRERSRPWARGDA